MGLGRNGRVVGHVEERVRQFLLLERRLWIARVSSPGVALVALSTIEVLLWAGAANQSPKASTQRAIRMLSGLKRRAATGSTESHSYRARAAAFVGALITVDRAQGCRIGAVVDSAILRFRAARGARAHGFHQLGREWESEREAIVVASMTLVVDAARGIATDRASFEVLVHEGMIGLLRSLDRFQEAGGVPFSVYSAWWVRASMHGHLRQADAHAALACQHEAEGMLRSA